MNALSIPTWIIHVSSVIEWSAAIALVWKYGEVTVRIPLGVPCPQGDRTQFLTMDES